MVGADDEIWDRCTCQAVGRETFKGVNPPWNPNRKTVSLMASKGTSRSQGPSGESWVPVLLALSLAACAHVLGDAGPFPSAQAKLLLPRDSPPQTPGLRGETCVLTCIGRDGWSQVQSRGGVYTPATSHLLCERDYREDTDRNPFSQSEPSHSF